MNCERLLAEVSVTRSWITELRAITLDCAMVGRLDQPVDAVHMTLLRRLGLIGPRAFVSRDFSAATVRAALGSAGLPYEDLAAWIRMRFEEPQVQASAQVLATILSREERDTAPALARRTLAPAPSWVRWRMLAKVLRPLLSLQTRADLTIEDAARSSTYSDAAGFYKACRSLLGCGPSTVRGWLGWESVLDRFVRHSTR